MKNKIQIVTAFLCGAVFFSGVSFAASELKIKQAPYKIKVDGVELKLSDSPYSINDRAYLPIRAMGDATGHTVQFDSKTNTINLYSEDYIVPKSDSAATVANKDGIYVKNLSTKYNNDKNQLDASLLKEAIKSGELNVNAQDEDTGESLLHLVIKQDNFPAYEVIKANKINPSLKDNKGLTPLHIAVINENRFYFGELDSEFKVKQYKDSQGKYPIDYAKEKSSMYNTLSFFVEKAE